MKPAREEKGGGTDKNLWSYLRVGALSGPCRPLDRAGLVFDRVADIDGVPDAYRAMNDRAAIKVMIEF